MSSAERVIDGLPTDVQDTLRSYVDEISLLFGPSLGGAILYGSAVRGEFLYGRSNLNILLLLTSYNLGELKKYAKAHRRWSREQIVVPLFLTESDLHSSADLFPIEYLDIKDFHRLLAGRDPLVGLQIDQRHLAAEVEQSLRTNLLRIRQRYVEGGGTEEAMTMLIPLSVTALLPVLRGIARLLGHPLLATTEPLLKGMQTSLEVDLSVMGDAIDLKRGLISPGPLEVPRLFDRYTSTIEVLIATVSELRKQGKL